MTDTALLIARISALEAELAESRLIILAERGAPAGALPGWETLSTGLGIIWCRYDGPSRDAGWSTKLVEGVWEVWHWTNDGGGSAIEHATTARAAMLAADRWREELGR